MILSINVPDEIAPRVILALSTLGGWTEESGKTRAQVARERVIRQIKSDVRVYESQQSDTELETIG